MVLGGYGFGAIGILGCCGRVDFGGWVVRWFTVGVIRGGLLLGFSVVAWVLGCVVSWLVICWWWVLDVCRLLLLFEVYF